jgi:hypothetical protein
MEKKFFLNFSVYFYSFAITSSWRGANPFISKKKSPIETFFLYGRKNSTSMFEFENVSLIWEKFPRSLFQMGLLPNSEEENFSQMDQMGETFSNGTSLWNIFSHMGKNNPIGLFLPWDFSWHS